MNRSFSIIARVALVLALAKFVGAAEPVKETAPVKEPAPVKASATPAKTQSPTEQAVRKAALGFDQAFNSGDAAKVAGLWTADAEYVDEDGHRYEGRDTIKKEYAEFFAANPHAKIVSVTDSVRVINDMTAIEDGRAMIQPPPEGAPASSRYTAVYTLQDGKWLVSSFHDMRVTTPSNYHKLDDFEWLIGTWHAGEGRRPHRIDVPLADQQEFCRTHLQSDYRRTALIVGDADHRLGSRAAADVLVELLVRLRLCQETWKPVANGWVSQSSGVLGDGTKTTGREGLSKAGRRHALFEIHRSHRRRRSTA